jgi:hypothetical protein
MTYTLTTAADITEQRSSLLAVAPDSTALATHVADWSATLDEAIVEVESFIESYRGPNLRGLLDWSDALADAYFDPDDWTSYASYVEALPTAITVED